MADALTGKTAKKQYNLAAAAQADQAAALDAQRAKQDAVEAGQRRQMQGGRGMLAFIDDELSTTFGRRAA